MIFLRRFAPAALLLTLLYAGCEDKKPAAAGPPPPPKVTVAKPIVRNVTQWDEYVGHLDAVETVDVKAQVSGFVQSVLFTEGAIVHKGDLLLTIDPQIFQAQLDNANAALEEARAKLNVSNATLQLHENDLARLQGAGAKGSISAGELDTAKFTVEQDKAVINQNLAAITGAQAAVKSAAQYVEWCKITAPITGRISSRNITVGNMLTGGAGTTTSVITTIKSIDPVYVYVNVDEASVFRYQQLARDKTRVSAVDEHIPCFLQLSSETDFPHTGTVDFVDNKIDPSTGTQRARGVFPNPDGSLLPGAFGRIRVTGLAYPGALLVMDDAIGLDQDRKYLYVLHPDKTVERRTVTTGPLIGELRVVLTGLKPDELVLVNGIMSLAFLPPGGLVDPTTVSMPETRFPQASTTTSPATAPSTTPATSGPATTEGTK